MPKQNLVRDPTKERAELFAANVVGIKIKIYAVGGAED